VPPRPLPYREVKRKLEAAGFAEVGHSGSHVKFAKHVQGGTRTAIVPHHREVASGTLRSIIRQAGLRIEEFEAL
jgi:predicted RNA binding protein YcfA (HicA-like mRNA interferase family)